MTIQELNHQNVCILGFGQEGKSVLKALEQYAPDAHITIADGNEKLKMENGELLKHSQFSILNSQFLEDLDQFDIIIKSPGIPPCKELDAVENKLTNSTQIFIDTVTQAGAIIVGITGSKGKSTTSSLIYQILKEAGKDTYLVGNIGIPTLDFIEHAKLNTIFVQEMSSYQLMQVTKSPHIAVVTSFFPEHLNYHGSLENYKKAKMHIAKFQTTEDIIFFDANSPGALDIASQSPGKHVPCSAEDSIIQLQDTRLIGEHNLRNIGLACKVAIHLHIPAEIIKQAIMKFTPLAHRLESLGVHHGIEWVNDAISTTPESTIAAIDALGDRVHTIILGGQDRGNDFSSLAERIKNAAIQNIIFIGESGPRIQQAIQQITSDKHFFKANNMEEIVEIAKKETYNLQSAHPADKSATCNSSLQKKQSPIVLLSTASPSYDMFKNFEAKGGEFKKWIVTMNN